MYEELSNDVFHMSILFLFSELAEMGLLAYAQKKPTTLSRKFHMKNFHPEAHVFHTKK